MQEDLPEKKKDITSVTIFTKCKKNLGFYKTYTETWSLIFYR